MLKKSNFIPSILWVLVFLLGFSTVNAQGKVDIPNPKLSVYVVDVGMGDAIFLDIPPKDCMLVDAGSWDNYGIDHLIQFLEDFFAEPGHEAYQNTIDVIVASHQHKDHIQGMLKVLKEFKVGTYIDNGVGCKFGKNKASKLVKDVEKLLKSKSIKHTQITDQLIESKGKKGVYTDNILDPFANIDVFALAGTPSPADANENDNSIVLKVKCDSISFLLTGDAEESEEQSIIERLKKDGNIEALDVDVLKAGHHGSNTASSEEFVQLTSPSMSVISVGIASESPKTKSFRLPKESVVRRLEQYTSRVLDEEWEAQMFPDKKLKSAKTEKPLIFKSKKEIYFTSSDGTVVFKTDGKKLKAESN
jgi:beta-lactamase superfamily II metal-dependent hydrolase